MEVRAWKLFFLLPFMLLRKGRGVGKVGTDELSRRFDNFSEGLWRILLEEARRGADGLSQSRNQGTSCLFRRFVLVRCLEHDNV